MKLSALKMALKPMALMPDANALTPINRCLIIHAGAVESFTSWGHLRSTIDFGIPETIAVEGSKLLAIINHSHAAEDVTFELKDHALHWKCGRSTGKLAIVDAFDIPEISYPKRVPANACKTDKLLAEAIDLGALSCGSSGLASIGMYGVQFDGDGETLTISASDNATISTASVPCRLQCNQTISPQGACLLADIIGAYDAQIWLGPEAIIIKAGNISASIGFIAPLKYSINDLMEKYSDEKQQLVIAQSAVQSFLRRAAPMADSKAKYFVTINVDNGALQIVFKNEQSEMEEIFVADDLKVPDLSSIDIEANRMAKVLKHASTLVLDYVPNVLILTAAKPKFKYLLSAVR